MKTPIFNGCCTALITPFKDGKVDDRSLKRLIEFQIEGGVNALLVCGTTGEAATLSNAEHEHIYNLCSEAVERRCAVICGIGSNNTQNALNRAKEAEEAGADAVLMVTPYYNKATQEGLIKHFFYVADRIDIPVIVYNVPGRTAIGIETSTYKALAKHPNINGVKEASGSLSGFANSIALCGSELNFWSGNDADTVGMMSLGARGVISVASNLLPDVISQLCHFCLNGNYEDAAVLNTRLSELFTKLFIEVNPIPIKAALNTYGFCSSELRLPLTELTDAHRRELMSCISSITK